MKRFVRYKLEVLVRFGTLGTCPYVFNFLVTRLLKGAVNNESQGITSVRGVLRRDRHLGRQNFTKAILPMSSGGIQAKGKALYAP